MKNIFQNNENVLFISDLHAPYNHKDSLSFLKALNKKYQFTKKGRIICLGDELDNHAMSFHESDPDLYSAGHETIKGISVLRELYKEFPKMDILESNHGSLVYRRAKTHGMPRHYILSYKDAIFSDKKKDGTIDRPKGYGDGWNWHLSLDFKLKSGMNVSCSHGMNVSTRRNIEQSGCCFVQGHHHNSLELLYHSTPNQTLWGMTCGCLLDDKQLAFAYNKNVIKRPIIGCGAIIDGIPRILPMNTNKNGRWNKKVP